MSGSGSDYLDKLPSLNNGPETLKVFCLPQRRFRTHPRRLDRGDNVLQTGRPLAGLRLAAPRNFLWRTQRRVPVCAPEFSSLYAGACSHAPSRRQSRLSVLHIRVSAKSMACREEYLPLPVGWRLSDARDWASSCADICFSPLPRMN